MDSQDCFENGRKIIPKWEKEEKGIYWFVTEKSGGRASGMFGFSI